MSTHEAEIRMGLWLDKRDCDLYDGFSQTLWVPAPTFFSCSSAVEMHHTCWMYCFRSLHKFSTNNRLAAWLSVAVDHSLGIKNVASLDYLNSLGKGAFLGFITAVPMAFGEYMIHNVMRIPSARQRHIGQNLMLRCLYELKKRKATYIELTCDPSGRDGTLCSFYESFGFRQLQFAEH